MHNNQVRQSSAKFLPMKRPKTNKTASALKWMETNKVKHRFRCHYTKSNPIDDHSNISSKNVTEAEFQTIGPLYLHAVWYLPFTKCPRKHTVTYHFSDLQEVYSGNRQIHTKCQLQYFHPPHISTSGKCHCVIIHQTTKATEYIG